MRALGGAKFVPGVAPDAFRAAVAHAGAARADLDAFPWARVFSLAEAHRTFPRSREGLRPGHEPEAPLLAAREFEHVLTLKDVDYGGDYEVAEDLERALGGHVEESQIGCCIHMDIQGF